jgi:hypothetical protein
MTTLLDQVPAAIGRVQREIVLARFIGKLAVDQGAREVRQRIEALLSPSAEHVGTVEPSSGDSPAPAEATAPVERIDVTSLALSDYDHLPAADIVSKLDALEPDERDAIEAYERSNRHRRTVLGKLAQLSGTTP